MKNVVLTGIKPTGAIHLGNYFGAIKPIIQLSNQIDNEVNCFVADLHALNLIKDPNQLKLYTRELVASLLALGLSERSRVYLQSHIPQISELATLLMPYTSKGILNRAHAYKAKVETNLKKGRDVDFAVNMGLFTYPVLMAADILLFDGDSVPIGKDQIQHIEICRNIAESVNFSSNKTLFTLPKFSVDESVSTIIGTDGRKMSKSYHNTIALFSSEKQFRKAIFAIKTDAKGRNEAKDPENCTVFHLFRHFASEEQTRDMRQQYLNGISYGEAKQELFELANDYMGEPRKRFKHLMENQGKIDEILEKNQLVMIKVAKKKLEAVKPSMGLR
ncbi:MAG: tryptophan--tRNA ligase [Pseudobacteriovorax sp.]|nr:tryptophan--tRNA ligase [Pseudobacteriovorax sp.]